MPFTIKTDAMAVKDPITGEYKTLTALRGEQGEGLITGGTKGQVLMKKSDDDNDTIWAEDGKNKYDKLYKDSSLSPLNSDSGSVKELKVYGRAEQNTYKGYNLLDISEFSGTARDNKGVVSTYENGDWKFVGTATETGNRWLNSDDSGTLVLKAGTYTMRCSLTPPAIFYKDNVTSKTYSINDNPFTLANESTIQNIAFGIASGTYYNGYLKFQIESGSTAHSYEPYVGGIASPNPSYPQVIKRVVNPIVKTSGKNLFDINSIGDIIANPTSGTVRQGLAIKISDGGNYTIYSSYVSSDLPICLARFLNGERLDSSPKYSTSTTFTFSMDGFDEVRIWVYNEDSWSAHGNVQLEKGSTFTDYEDYASSSLSIPITLNAIPTTDSSLANYTDNDGNMYISDYVDCDKGVVVRNVGVADMSDAWSDTLSPSGGNLSYIQLDDSSVKLNGKSSCNMLPIDNSSAWSSTTAVMQISPSANRIRIYDTVTTLSDFKTKYADIVIYYELASPTEESISVSYDLSTYNPTTNISVTSDEVNGGFECEYPIRLKDICDSIPTKVSDITNDIGFTTNTGTVTSVAVKMNSTTKGTITSAGTIDLGTVLTSDRLFKTFIPTGTQITAGADLNTTTYLKVGRYYCSSNTTAQGLSNCPCSGAFMMEVYSPLSTSIDNEDESKAWIYRTRIITTYQGAQYIETCDTDSEGTWYYRTWTKIAKVGDIPTKISSLTNDSGFTTYGGMSVTSLWTNSAPTSSFAAQTVSVDLSSYPLCLVYFYDSGAYIQSIGMVSSDRYTNSVFFNGSTSMASSVTRTALRLFNVMTTGIYFSSAYESTLGPYIYGGQNDGRIIPVSIWGIK